jgi:hypothetical protein
MLRDVGPDLGHLALCRVVRTQKKHTLTSSHAVRPPFLRKTDDLTSTSAVAGIRRIAWSNQKELTRSSPRCYLIFTVEIYPVNQRFLGKKVCPPVMRRVDTAFSYLPRRTWHDRCQQASHPVRGTGV